MPGIEIKRGYDVLPHNNVKFGTRVININKSDVINTRKMIILASFTLLFAIFIIPSAYADNSCIDCHKTLAPFIEAQKQFNQVKNKHLEIDVSCSLECHEDKIRQRATANYQQWYESVHAQRGVTCEACHGGDPEQATREKAHIGITRFSESNNTGFPNELRVKHLERNVPCSLECHASDLNEIPKDKDVSDTCGKCHTDELKQFKNSAHFQTINALKPAKTCDLCHLPHEFKIMNPEESRNFCGNCHSATKKVAPYEAAIHAESAIQDTEKLKNEIYAAERTIMQAKQEGKDVSTAQKDIDNAVSIRDSLPELWHRLDLLSFESVLTNGTKAAQKAQQESGTPEITIPETTPSSQGSGVTLSLAGIIAMVVIVPAVLFLLKRKTGISKKEQTEVKQKHELPKSSYGTETLENNRFRAEYRKPLCIEIKRGYEVLPDNNVRFGIRVINNSDSIISDVEVILDYSESLFDLEGSRVQKLGNIPPTVPRTAKFILKPLGCIHKEEIGATVRYKDHRWKNHTEEMRPKEVHCVCPFLKEKSITRAEFLALSNSGYLEERGVNFDNITYAKLVDFLSHACKNRLYKVDEVSIDNGKILYLAGDAVGEKAYYLLTAVVKEYEGLTQVMLRANSDKSYGLNGFLNEILDNLRHLVKSAKAREIGIVSKEQVINIIDSVVQRTTFEGGEGEVSVNIKDSVVQRAEIKGKGEEGKKSV